MIYTVECAFSDPARESAWNDWYGGEKLDVLLSVPGFRASQRFRAQTAGRAPYLAVHSVRDAAVLEQAAYRDVGGGTFGGWDALVTDWDRNLFTGLEVAPEVAPGQRLVLLDDPAAQAAEELDFTWLDIAGLDRTTERRGFAIAEAGKCERLGPPFRVFAPITPRRVSPHGLDG